MNQWNRIESPEINPHTYFNSDHTEVSQFLIEEARLTMDKRQTLHKCCWENWTATYKKMNLEHYRLTPHTKINSK